MFRFHHRHNAFPHVVGGSSLILISLLFVGCGTGGNSSAPPPSVAATGTPGAEADVGERLFLDTRFAQSFKVFLDNGGSINDPNAGDPVVNTVETLDPATPIDPSPFKGMSMNCRSYHFVDDVLKAPGGGMRTYADFARRSPIPARAEDSKTHTPRNSPALVNSSLWLDQVESSSISIRSSTQWRIWSRPLSRGGTSDGSQVNGHRPLLISHE